MLELKKKGKEAEIVWIATDPDREGEAISWHIIDMAVRLFLDRRSSDTFTFFSLSIFPFPSNIPFKSDPHPINKVRK